MHTVYLCSVIVLQCKWHLGSFAFIKYIYFRREIGEIVRYLPNKKNKTSAASQTVTTARIAPKICQGQSPSMYSECSRFQPSRLTFGGVIVERVNTAKLPVE